MPRLKAGRRSIRESNGSAPRHASKTVLVDRELLYSEIADFADIHHVLAAAIDRVDGAELLQQFASPAEPSDRRSESSAGLANY